MQFSDNFLPIRGLGPACMAAFFAMALATSPAQARADEPEPEPEQFNERPYELDVEQVRLLDEHVDYPGDAPYEGERAWRPDVRIDGVALEEGLDYALEYASAPRRDGSGLADVVVFIKGRGSYEGIVARSFTAFAPDADAPLPLGIGEEDAAAEPDEDALRAFEERDADLASEEAPVAPSAGDAEAKLSPLSVSASIGDCFIAITDEGQAVLYRVTSEETVSVGGGKGYMRVLNPPDDETKKNGMTTVTTSYSGVLTIPESVNYMGKAYKVTSVADYAFGYFTVGMSRYNYAISGIVLPSSVTSIGSHAFDWANLSKGISYSGECNVATVGERAFSTTSMSSFEVKKSMVSLGEGLFEGRWFMNNKIYGAIAQISFEEGCQLKTLPERMCYMTKLTKIALPSCVTGIGAAAFRDCSLTDVLVPKTVTKMGDAVFAECAYLERARFEEGTELSELPASTFSDCTHLTAFDFNPSFASIESYCFSGTGLLSILIPKTLTYLGEYAFSNCSVLREVLFEEGHQLRQITKGLFSGCKALPRIELPSNVRSIGAYAFEECRVLQYIVFPRQCVELGAFAFQKCPALKTVVFLGDASDLVSQTSTFYLDNAITRVIFADKRSKNLVIPSAMPKVYYTISYYRTEADRKAGEIYDRLILLANTVPSAATEDETYASGLLDYSLVPVAPPAGMNWVYEGSFRLDSELSDSVYAVGEPIAAALEVGDTFTARTLEGTWVTYTVTSKAEGSQPGTCEVGQPSGAHSLSASAVSVKTTGAITLPALAVAPDANTYRVTSIGDYAFAGCSKIISVTIPASVQAIGSHAFYRNTMLRNVYFDSDAENVVDDRIFSSCPNIKLVVFGGKKANISFDASTPDVYYAVTYYDSKHDLQIGNTASRVFVHERAQLGSLREGDVLQGSGSVPALKLGYEWEYEPGFSATAPLSNSCFAFAQGIGFEMTVSVREGNVDKTSCWFKIIDLDEDTHTGTVMVGLGKDGITAVHTGVSGTPVIPRIITDEAGNTFTVVGVSDYAFGSASHWQACHYLDSVVLPYTVAFIGEYAFAYCEELTSIVLPSQLEEMRRAAFKGCVMLASVDTAMSAKLKAIPNNAFEGCSRLASFSVPEAVESIGDSAFANCFMQVVEESQLKGTLGLKTFDLSRVRLLRSIGNRAFYNDRLLFDEVDLAFAEGLESIGAEAFYFCDKITGLIFPTTFKSLGANAFQYCEKVAFIRFMGDASDLSLGTRCFAMGKPVDGGVTGALDRVEYMGKKYHGIEPFIYVARSLDTDNNYRRGYRLYYNITFYASQADFEAGKPIYSNLILEDERGYSVAPSLKAGRTWRCEDGFGMGERTVDSYWATIGLDLAYATVSGVQSSYYYEGVPIRPVPILSFEASPLVEGVHYVYDSAFGAYHDGYTNNRRMGTASIHLLGIGDFAGTKVVSFEIAPYYDAASKFEGAVLPGNYVYSGNAIQPRLSVSITVKGNTYAGTEGVDYTVSYENNVNAGTGYALINGMGAFSSTRRVPFTILPMDISRCTVVRAEGNWVDGQGVVMTVQLVGPNGAQLFEGRDYRLNTQLTFGFMGGTVFAFGQGNYAGVLARTFSVGGHGGSGGGTGTGEGAGPGTGTGAGSDAGAGSGGETDELVEGLSDAFGALASAAGSQGGESGGAKWHLFTLSGADLAIDAPIELEFPYAVPIIAFSIMLVAGAAASKRSWNKQTTWFRRLP